MWSTPIIKNYISSYKKLAYALSCRLLYVFIAVVGTSGPYVAARARGQNFNEECQVRPFHSYSIETLHTSNNTYQYVPALSQKPINRAQADFLTPCLSTPSYIALSYFRARVHDEPMHSA